MGSLLIRARQLAKRLAGMRAQAPIQIPDADEAALWHCSGAEAPFRQEYDLCENSLVFDLGGYEGQWAADIHARYGCRVHIFEPVPFYARKMTRRFARNPRIVVHAFGLAENSGWRRISVANDQSSLYRLSDKVVDAEFRDAELFLRDGGFTHIDLMKINIEGGEYSLVPRLINSGCITTIGNLQIQFHEWFDQANVRRDTIRRQLAMTHRQTFSFPFVWENWERLPTETKPTSRLSRASATVSVIIPTYNRCDTLPAALQSVLDQSDIDCEVIVADDGSTDGTSDVVSDWAPRFNGRLRYLGLAHVGRCGTPRNVALRAATGDYVAFLDSDDAWLPGKIAAQLAVFETCPHVGLVSTNAFVSRPGTNDERRSLYLPTATTALNLSVEDFVQSNPIILSTAVARRELVDRAGGFSNDIRLLGLEDYDLWLKLSLQAECRCLPQATTVYKDNPLGSVRGHWALSDYMNGMLLALEHLEKFASGHQLWTARLAAVVRRRRRSLAMNRFLFMARECRPVSGLMTFSRDMLTRRPYIWHRPPRHLDRK